jgi:alpha-acetolactate decarboxylase
MGRHAVIQRCKVMVRALVVASVACACSSPGWNEPVRTWGTMHAVMHDGRTEGKVRIADAVASPDAVGIGALAGLLGEIVIVDGVVWTSRVVDAPRVDTEKGRRAGDEAALLAVTRVSRWSEHTLDRDLALEELGDYLRKLADASGLAHTATFPFLVRGDLDALDAHVLNGRCPYSGPGASQTDPVQSTLTRASGTLVGFYTELEPGILTHQGSRTHVHVLIEGTAPFVGHVDGVLIQRGARISLPEPL